MEGLARPKPLAVPNDQAVQELRTHCGKLEQVIFRLRGRERALFNMCTASYRRTDTPRAQIYANEIVQVRILLNIVTQTQLAIECITIRIENLMELHGLITEMKPLSKMIQSVSRHIQRVMPDVGSEVGQLGGLVSDTLAQTSIDFSQPSMELSGLTAGTFESEEILKEVSSYVEAKMKTDLPEPPSLTVPVPAANVSRGVALQAIPASLDTKMRDGGSSEGIDITHYARKLNLLPENVLRMLDDLSSRGRVKLEECVT